MSKNLFSKQSCIPHTKFAEITFLQGNFLGKELRNYIVDIMIFTSHFFLGVADAKSWLELYNLRPSIKVAAKVANRQKLMELLNNVLAHSASVHVQIFLIVIVKMFNLRKCFQPLQNLVNFQVVMARQEWYYALENFQAK